MRIGSSDIPRGIDTLHTAKKAQWESKSNWICRGTETITDISMENNTMLSINKLTIGWRALKLQFR
jgi:hypothetical protein